jgi:hypothetical protein
LIVSTPTTLLEACTVLFGPQVQVSNDFLRYLRPSGVKAAYHQRAFETHPDRARGMGLDEAVLTERFKAINLAYEHLRSVVTEDGYMGADRTADPFGTSSSGWNHSASNMRPENRKQRSDRKKKQQQGGFTSDFADDDHYYTGEIPKVALVLGRFMYYSGMISWKTLLNAIIWHRKNSPPLGRIAQDWGYLTAEEITRILAHKINGEKFGEIATRLGLLTPLQLLAILGKQRNLKQPFGEYFIKNGIYRPVTLEEIVERQKEHNRNIARLRASAAPGV